MRWWTRCLHVAGGKLGIRIVVAELFVGQNIVFVGLEDHLIHSLVGQWEIFVLINGGFLQGNVIRLINSQEYREKPISYYLIASQVAQPSGLLPEIKCRFIVWQNLSILFGCLRLEELWPCGIAQWIDQYHLHLFVGHPNSELGQAGFVALASDMVAFGLKNEDHIAGTAAIPGLFAASL